MPVPDPVMESLFSALRSLNELRPPDRQIAVEAGTPIMGAGADFDSMDLVNLFLFAEEALNSRGLEAPSLIELGAQMGELSPLITLEHLSREIDRAMGHPSRE